MAWGNRESADTDFRKLCEQISSSKTNSASLTILRSRYAVVWEKANCPILLANALRSNTSLVELNCLGLDFTVQGCRTLAEALKANKTLKRLSIGHERFGDEQLLALLSAGTLGTIEYLDLERRSLTSASGEAIGRAIGLPGSHLVTLNLAFNALSDEGLKVLANGLLSSNGAKLTTLDLKSNELSNAGVEVLAKALVESKILLKRLDLSWNPSMGSRGVGVLADVSADELILEGCNGGDDGCLLLAEGKPRQVLSLAENELTASGAAIVAERIFLHAKHDHHTVSLRLARNTNIGTEGVEAIGSVLQRRQRMFPEARVVKTLDLSLVGATRLPHSLVSGCVTSLSFIGNGPLEHIELIEALQIESTIECLALSGTGITNITEVFRALQTHSSLTTVEFGGIPLDEIAREELRILRETNPRLDIAVDKGVQDEAPQ